MYQNIFVERNSDIPTAYIWDDVRGLVTLPVSEFNYAYIRDPKGKFLSMTGERVSKVYRFNRNGENIFESDLPIETRILTDLYLDEDTPSSGHVTLFFDIEVSMENGIPDIHTPNNEITSIALYDPTIEKYVVIVLDKQNIYEDVQREESDIYFSDTEVGLLHKFMNIYEQIQPTIITGWNSDGFDVPYLYNRIKQVCGPSVANRLSPIGKVKYSDRREKYQIAGVNSLDYMVMYKKFTYTQQQNYRLDTIGRLEVGMGKVEYEGSLDDLFRDDLERFIEYNLQDVRIIVELDKKLKLIELVRAICHVGHVPYEEYWYSSKFLEGTIVTYLHRKGIIVTNKPAGGQEKMEEMKDNNEQGFAGAFVKEPVPGRYEWVYSLDLQSLYPSIIMSLNISPETKVGFVQNWDLEKHFKKEIVAYVIQEVGNDMTIELEYPKFVEFLEENNLSISSNGVLYGNDKVGIIPEVLDTWFAQRKEYKDLMKKYTNEGDKEKADYYDRRQHIQKIFLNSLYGVLGLPVFRFYDVDNALAVTATGQDVIKNTAKVASLQYKKKIGIDGDFVTYIDTDSIYCSATPLMPNNLTFDQKKEFTIDLARGIEDTLNKFYDVFAKRAFNCSNHRFYIKGEAVASAAFWVAKKRYALDKVYDLETNQDVEKVAVKGLDVVRSSFPQAFRIFMKDMLSDILKAVPKGEIDGKILTFKDSLKDRHFLEIARNTSTNNISEYGRMDKDVALTQFKKGTPAHIKAAITYNRLLTYFGVEKQYEPITDGSKVKYVYLKNNPLKIDALAIKGYQDPPEIISMVEDYIDTDALFENELRNKLDDFYSALKWGNIPTEVNQKADQFFSF
jgi:DNA polymerase elongation subunit (family B)